jgi:PucR family transcriptional regulator, purine catabolism regulatory protein
MPTLSEALRFPALAAAGPVVRVASEDHLQRNIRWVHSSEVLDIASLLRGGEVLLSGGSQLSVLSAAERRAYVEALAACDLAALAVEITGWDELAVDLLSTDAQSAGLTLIVLTRTVRFVDIAEEINSAIVNHHARIQSIVDDVSRRIAERISMHGPDLPEILNLAADALQARVSLLGPEGVVQEAGDAVPEEVQGGSMQEAGIVVGGHVAARLRLESATAGAELLAAATGRLTEVLALALAQSFRPSPDQVAEVRLMRAILDEASSDAVRRLWATTSLPYGPACVVLGQSLGPPSAHESVLRRAIAVGAGAPWGRGRAVLVPLGDAEPRRRRAALVSALADAVDGGPVRCVVGPLVWDGSGTHASFAEARDVLEDDVDRPGVVDVSARFGQRVVARLEATPFVPVEVRAALGRVQDWDRQHGTALVETLARWLDSGCHATATAARLHIERQTLHKRLAKAFELLGEDPRGSGDVFPLHVAVRVAMMRTDS